MLNINIEFRKGILFVRLKGILDKHTLTSFRKEVSNLIYINGIKYLVLNLKDLEYMDNLGLKQVINDYYKISSLDGKVVICGIEEKDYKKELSRYTYISQNELKAFQLINI